MAILGVIVSLLYFVLTLPPRPSRAKVRKDHLRQAEDARRAARQESETARRHRVYARNAARNLELYQWGSVFYTDTLPTMAAGYAKHVPDLQKRAVSYANSARFCEQAAEERMAVARKHQQAADRLEPRPRRQSDLLLLARVCWEGARRARIRRLESSRVSSGL